MSNAYGENQFAYSPGRGARDALLFLVLTWLLLMVNGRKIALYCSDVSGVFDKVDADRLIFKLCCLGINSLLLFVFSSWLRYRTAKEVLVGGTVSQDISMSNMVYQGTVWGPAFWNCFYRDAKDAIRKSDFTEIIYADDLNAFKAYENRTSNETIFSDMYDVQGNLQRWGRANRVSFDAAKESFHIISRVSAAGSNFKTFGGQFRLQVDNGYCPSRNLSCCVVEGESYLTYESFLLHRSSDHHL